jgi:asparagine synthase (glutamine-hydrolysing)
VLSALAREDVTVVLSGDGGDETHAGYPRYLRMARLAGLDRIPLALRRLVAGPLARAAPSFWRRGGPEQLCRPELDRYDAMTRELPRAHRWAAYSDALRARLGEQGLAPAGEEPSAWRRSVAALAPGQAPVVDRFQALDLASYLPEQLMTKLDRATMRVGLEARVPLLDLAAVELAARLPTSLRARNGRPKHLLRRLLARKMGEPFVERRKHGFRVPAHAWLSEIGPAGLAEIIFSDGVEDWLDRDRLGALLRHPRGAQLAWPFLMFAYWHQAYRPEGPR